MEYLVTARKWRPQRFEDVVGQEHITSTLKNALKLGRVAHAFLFTGPRGVGKTTTARILAKSLNCQNPEDYEPCNKCSMCKSISNSQTMDIIEIDAASNRGIDEIRTLRESVKYAPTAGKFKVYIIDEVHMLTKESFNAFLKTLEEPPSHTVFIFATTDVHKVPLTIVSRCQRFDFRRIQLDVIKQMLLKIANAEGISIDDKTLTTISKKADGALRDAESYFDQVVAFCGNKIDFDTVTKMLNLIDEEIYFKISDAILAKDFNAVFETSDLIFKNGWDFLDFLDGLAEHFRNILSVNITHQTSLIESAEIFRKKYAEYIDTFSKGDLIRILNFINKTQQEIRFSQNQRLKVEIALTHLIGLERTQTINELIVTIDSNQSSDRKPLKVSEPQKKTENEIKVYNTIHQSINKNSNPSESSLTDSIITDTNNVLTKGISTDFNEIFLKWQSLIDIVQQERSLILGNIFTKLQLLELKGQDLRIAASSSEVESEFELHRDYIDKKIQQVFGKKLNLKLTVTGKNPTREKTSKKEKKTINDSLEKLIIEELGAEEIS